MMSKILNKEDQAAELLAYFSTSKSTTPKDLIREEQILCPITYMSFKNAVKAADGVTYEEETIKLWFKVCKDEERPLVSPTLRDPKTNKPIPMKSEKLIPDEELMAILKRYKEAGGRPINDGGCFTSTFFHDLDRLGSSDIMRDLNLHPLQIVALGRENDGKSTTLERIIGFPLFPKDKFICTVSAIRVSLRRNSMMIPKVYIRSRKGDKLVLAGSVEYCSLTNICDVVKEKMSKILELNPGKTIVDTMEVCVEVTMPYVPNLDIVDLPGIVNAIAIDADMKKAEVTRDLAKQIIESEKDHSIFLLINDCRNQVSNNSACGLVQECGIEKLTVLILTKLDRYSGYDDDEDDEKDVHEVLAGKAPGSVHFKNGIMICSSRVSRSEHSGPNTLARLRKMDVEENKLLSNKYPSLLTNNCAGMGKIKMKLIALFERYLISSWIPKIHSHTVNELSKTSIMNANLGLPMVANDTNLTIIKDIKSMLLTVCPDFNTDLLKVFDSPHDVYKLLSERSKMNGFFNSAEWLNIPDLTEALEAFDLLVALKNVEWFNREANCDASLYTNSMIEANVTENKIRVDLERIIEKLSKSSQTLMLALRFREALTKDDYTAPFFFPSDHNAALFDLDESKVFENAIKYNLVPSDIESLNVKDLRAFCDRNFIDTWNCIEKNDLRSNLRAHLKITLANDMYKFRWSEFSALTNVEQARITKLSRFDKLLESLQDHLNSSLDKASKIFENKALTIIDEVTKGGEGGAIRDYSLVINKTFVRSIDGKPRCKLSMKNNIQELPHVLQDVWFNKVPVNVDKFVDDFQPKNVQTEIVESCNGERVNLLTQMREYFKVLLAIHQLKLKSEEELGGME